MLYSDFTIICGVFYKSLSILAIVLPYAKIVCYCNVVGDGLVEIGESDHE